MLRFSQRLERKLCCEKFKSSLAAAASPHHQTTMTKETDDLLSSIYSSSPSSGSRRNVFSVAVTGGGSGIIGDLFTVPGASNSLMNASVPYSRAAVTELVGTSDRPSSCTRESAVLIAKAAFKKTVGQLLVEEPRFDILSECNIFGISCTASLVSSRPKKGLHRCHVASFSNSNQLRTYDVCFQKGLRTRREEDDACSRLVLDAIASSSCVPKLGSAYLQPNSSDSYVDEYNPDVVVEEVNESSVCTAGNAFDKLFAAETPMLVFVRKSSVKEDADFFDQFTLLEDISIPPGSFVYPGSYNPLHEGHINLAAAAIQLKKRSLDAPVVFEISALNADKPPLSKDEIMRRVRQFCKGSESDKMLQKAGLTNVAVCITSRPFFQSKAALFPDCNFIMGADTLSRLLQYKYYENSRDNMIAALCKITEAQNCSIIVGGRKDSSRELGFIDLKSVLETEELPRCVTEKLFGLSEEQFRADISSTEIRNAI